jgi:hypothetical protein
MGIKWKGLLRVSRKCDIIRNPIWRIIQDGGIVIFNAFLQYGYQMKGLVFLTFSLANIAPSLKSGVCINVNKVENRLKVGKHLLNDSKLKKQVQTIFDLIDI